MGVTWVSPSLSPLSLFFSLVLLPVPPQPLNPLKTQVPFLSSRVLVRVVRPLYFYVSR